MNERIKELIWETDEWLESNAQSDRWEREIKFAELIVGECMLQCDIPESGNTPLSKDFNEGHIMGVYECFHKIKNHFGVEE